MFTHFRSRSGPLLCSFVVAAAVLLNWPAAISNKTNRIIGSSTHRQIEVCGCCPCDTAPRESSWGGWPFTFTITNEFASGPPSQHFAWPNLLGNMLVFSCVLIFFWLYERRGNRAGSDSGNARAELDRRGEGGYTSNHQAPIFNG